MSAGPCSACAKPVAAGTWAADGAVAACSPAAPSPERDALPPGMRSRRLSCSARRCPGRHIDVGQRGGSFLSPGGSWSAGRIVATVGGCRTPVHSPVDPLFQRLQNAIPTHQGLLGATSIFVEQQRALKISPAASRWIRAIGADRNRWSNRGGYLTSWRCCRPHRLSGSAGGGARVLATSPVARGCCRRNGRAQLSGSGFSDLSLLTFGEPRMSVTRSGLMKPKQIFASSPRCSR